MLCFRFFSQKKEAKEDFHALLNELRSMDTYEIGDYQDETKKEIEDFKKHIERFVNEILETENPDLSALREKIQSAREKQLILEKKFQEADKQWGELVGRIEKTVEKGVSFLEKTNFYPPEYVFDINKLKGHILDIDEQKKENPLGTQESYEQLRQKVELQLDEFTLLHQETIELIEKNEKKKNQKEKEERQEILEIKERLFRYLQMGKLDLAKSELKKLKKEINRI